MHAGSILQSPPDSAPDVPLLDRIRAMCALAGLGAIKPKDVSKHALDAAVHAVHSGEAFRQSPYADAVNIYSH